MERSSRSVKHIMLVRSLGQSDTLRTSSTDARPSRGRSLRDVRHTSIVVIMFKNDVPVCLHIVLHHTLRCESFSNTRRHCRAIRLAGYRTDFEPNLPIAGIGGKEPKSDASISGLLDLSAHFPGPIFIVSDREPCFMGSQLGGIGMRVDIGAVRHVVSFPFEPPDHVVFPSCQRRRIARWNRIIGQEFTGPHSKGGRWIFAHEIGSVKGNLAGRTADTVKSIQRSAPPQLL